MAEPSDLSQFLNAVWPDLGGGWCLLWGTPSKRSEWVQSFSPDTVTMLETWAQKENVYMGCALRGANLGATLRGGREDCTAIPGAWLDIDFGPEHKKPNLPPTEETAHELIAMMGVPASAIVHSGRGLQAWWLFKEPWIFEGDADRAEAEALTKGWCATLRAHAHTKGWDADQVGDLPRVMRLPGLWNRKGVPKRTKLLELTEHRYNPDELRQYLTQMPDQTAPLPAVAWQFELSPGAEPPAEKFFTLCEIDTLFKLSWLRGRKDLHDQSGSSYDLSLASRAFAAGWSGQEVVNLLIAHRRKHKDDLKLRKDYYERTLNKALSSKEEETRKQVIDDLKAGKPVPATLNHDPAEAQAVLSEVLGVKITKFIRFVSEHNTYQLEVDGHLINVPSIDEFDSQVRFRRVILDKTDKQIPVFKAARWGELLNLLFSTVQNVEVSIGTSKGSFENWIEEYLSDGVEPEERWQQAAIDNRPFRYKNDTYLVTGGFLRFLRTQAGERLTAENLGIILTKLGHKHERKTVKNRKGVNTKRSMWRIQA